MKILDLKLQNNVPDDWSQFFDYNEDIDYLKREAEKNDFGLSALIQRKKSV